MVAEGKPTSPLKFGRLSPDGKLVAYVRPTDQPQRHVRLYYRELKSPDAEIDLGGVEINGLFVWSPDSTEIAFAGAVLEDDGSKKKTDKEGEKLTSHWLVNLQTKKTRPLKLPEGHTMTDWSRDGKYLLTENISLVGDPPHDAFGSCT